jgi:hypothetical protein
MTNTPISTADPLLIEAEKSLYSSLVPTNPTNEEMIVGAIALSTYWRSKHTHAEKYFQEYGNPVDARALRVELSVLKDPNECKKLISNSRASLQGYLESTKNAELVNTIEKIVKDRTKFLNALLVNLVSALIYAVLAFVAILLISPTRSQNAFNVLIGQDVITTPVDGSKK